MTGRSGFSADRVRGPSASTMDPCPPRTRSWPRPRATSGSPAPTPRSVLAASSQDFASLGAAEQAAGFHVLAPAYLPAGYDLTTVQSVSYEQLPVWLRPLYVGSTYRPERPRPEQVYVQLRPFTPRQSGDVQQNIVISVMRPSPMSSISVRWSVRYQRPRFPSPSGK